MNKLSLILFLLGIGVYATTIAAPPQTPLTVNVQGDGAVTGVPAGIVCPTDCDESYKKGTVVTLTAKADPDSSFLGWSGACIGTDPECVVKILTPTVVTATFDTAAVVYPAPLPKTGQVSCWDVTGSLISCDGTGHDGDIQAGAPSPSPRFVDIGDGTVTDNLTGLTWLKDANCIKTHYPGYGDSVRIGAVTWQQALDFVSGMNNGTYSCSGNYTDWRVPNVREMLSLVDYEEVDLGKRYPVPANHPFENLTEPYWTSTTVKGLFGEGQQAFIIFQNVTVQGTLKTDKVFIWPVRDSQ